MEDFTLNRAYSRVERPGRVGGAAHGCKVRACGLAAFAAVLAVGLGACDAPREAAGSAVASAADSVGGDAAGAALDGAGNIVVAPDAASPLAGADLGRGEVLSYACRACHGFTPRDESPIGPSLTGVFGRPAAALEGFDYSRALRESGIVWTPAELDAWLAQPNDYLPGNNMAFAGFRSSEDRRDLIAYLLEQTAGDEAAAGR